jgi:hypothetical protein
MRGAARALRGGRAKARLGSGRMSGFAWIMVVVIAVLASGLILCAAIVIVIAVLFATSSRLFTRDSDQ